MYTGNILSSKPGPYLCYHHDCFRGAAFHTPRGVQQIMPRHIIRDQNIRNAQISANQDRPTTYHKQSTPKTPVMAPKLVIYLICMYVGEQLQYTSAAIKHWEICCLCNTKLTKLTVFNKLFVLCSKRLVVLVLWPFWVVLRFNYRPVVVMILASHYFTLHLGGHEMTTLYVDKTFDEQRE